MITHKDSVISHAGFTRIWNFYIILTLCAGLIGILGLIMIVYEVPLIEISSGVVNANVGAILILGAVVIVFFTMIRLFIIIKCPNCKLRWYWYAVSKDFERNIMLGHKTNCPRCNYPEVPEK
jgi:hypothetical protein